MKRNSIVAPIVIMIAVISLTGCASKGAGQKAPGTTGKGAVTTVFELKSEAFVNGGVIPVKYAKSNVTGGQNLSVPLSWTGAPSDTRSFALVCVDRNPIADNWIHWAVIGISASTTSIQEGASGAGKMPAGSQEMNNTFGDIGYGGPTPPAGTGAHTYEFILYALNTDNIEMQTTPTLAQFEAVVSPVAIASAKVAGTMER